MLSKRARGYNEEEVAPEKRFRRNLGDCFLGGTLSGMRTSSLVTDANLAGTKHVADLEGQQRADGKNAARDLTTKLLKGHKWPRHYVSEIRVKNPKTNEAGSNKFVYLYFCF